MSREWTLGDVVRATGARPWGDDAPARALDAEVSGAVLDSRQASAGRVFVALPGARSDGHAFVAAALAAGATAAFCHSERAAAVAADCAARGVEPAGRLLAVPDPAAALGAWAHARREAWGGDLVGVCGSNGKTTTKEMLASILARRARTARSEGNLNNHLGVPVTLTRLVADDR